MNRETIYIIRDDEKLLSTFQYDENLPSLPLPKLEDTLKRYYETLKPFGNEEQLKKSLKIIENFKNGIGKDLQAALEEIASKEKNWVDKFWSEYAYFTLRVPLQPYCTMAMALDLQSVFVPESKESSLKVAARVLYHTLEHWNLLRNEKLKPASAQNGKIKFSSNLWRKFYSTSRIPGDPKDRIDSYFKPISEGTTPSHGIFIGKGRIFKVDCLNDDDTILSPQQILAMLRNIRGILDYEPVGSCIPVLTCDERNGWAKNRKHLKEISPHNRNLLKLIESSAFMITLDENEPVDYAESSLMSITGDFHSKWADRTSIIVLYKNGKIACEGEHSAYDGSISVSYAFFILLSLYEIPEPDWSIIPRSAPLPIEVNFQTDDYIKSEIQRVIEDCDSRRHDVIVTYSKFNEFGKDYLKTVKLHPDAFIQMVLQLTYYELHGELAATYETALMRDYYHGRTETVRSCTTDCKKFVMKAHDENISKKELYDLFKKAIDTHNHMMSEARKGNGIDRHLFALWCIAYEKNLDIPDLYTDELYVKSGGGGNFILSTSTLGYTVSTGFVAPMLLDGYGVFYSIISDYINIQISAYRQSIKTSAYKFDKKFQENMIKMKNIVDEYYTASKL